MKNVTYILVFIVLTIQYTPIPAQSPNWEAKYDSANSYYKKNQYTKSLQFFYEIYPILAQQPDVDTIFFNVNMSMGVLLLNLGLTDSAEKYTLIAQQMAEKHYGKISKEYAQTLSSLGKLAESRTKYATAESLYTACSEIRKKVLGPQDHDYLFLQFLLARIYIQVLNYQAAETLLTKTLADCEQYGHQQTILYPNLLFMMGVLYNHTKKLRLAEQYCQQAIAAFQKINPKHPQVYAVYHELISIYNSNYKFKQAQSLYDLTDSAMKQLFGTNHPNYVIRSLQKACLLRDTEQFDQALILFDKILTYEQDILGKQHNEYYNTLNNISTLYEMQRLFRKADSVRKISTQLLINQIHEIFPTMSEKEKKAFNAKIQKHFNVVNYLGIELFKLHSDTTSTATKDTPYIQELAGRLYNYQLITKGLLLSSTTRMRNRILSSGDAALKNLFNHWIATKTQIGKLYSSTVSINKRQATIDSLEQLSNQLEKKLSKQSELFAAQIDTIAPTWEKIRDRLKPHEAAIEIVRVQQPEFKPYGITDSSDTVAIKNNIVTYKKYPTISFGNRVCYLALILLPGCQSPGYTIIESDKATETKHLANYRSAILLRKADTLSYNYFWKPIARHLPAPITDLYISLDGVYNQINLAAIQDPQRQNYLIDQYNLHLLTSTRELIKAKSANIANQKLAIELIGNPAFAPKNQTAAYNLLAPLPGAETEVKKIAALFQAHPQLIQSCKVYLGNQATETALKKIQNPHILHIATHGYFVQGQPLTQNKDQQKLAAEPLLRSGLLLTNAALSILADANDSTNENIIDTDLAKPDTAAEIDNGILTAYEACNLHLDSTYLVVLSACETGRGEVLNGEGVYGLQRSLQVAGAKNIIMSLWRVDDTATQELMNLFYNKWLYSSDIRQAFSQTQREIKNKHPHPYYWAPFVIIGN